MNLATRSELAELMDGADYTGSEYAQCLRQLRVLNVLTRGYAPTLKALSRFAAKLAPGEVFRVLDVGFGYGDTLRRISRWSRAQGLPVELTGIDLNPCAASLARAATPQDTAIRYLTGNAFGHMPERPYHVIVNALFMHHLSEVEVPAMMRWMADNATLGFFINDLHRHWLPYGFIFAFTRALGFNAMIQNDAPLSVARGFRSAEWQEYALEACLDLERLKIKWHWPFRYGVRYEL